MSLRSIVHSMMLGHLVECRVAGPGCMGRDTNTRNVAVTLHEYTNVYLELDLQAKCHHPVGLWENHLLLLCYNILEGVICTCMVLLCWWRRFCSFMEWAAIWCRALFIRTTECQTAAYRAVPAGSSRGAFCVVCSCGKCCGRVKRDIFICRNAIYLWCSSERSRYI